MTSAVNSAGCAWWTGRVRPPSFDHSAATTKRVTPEALIVAETKNPGDENDNRQTEAIDSVSNLPGRYVIDTQHHPDPVGTNQKFVGGGARVLASEAMRTHMAGNPSTKEIPGPPTETFAKDLVLISSRRSRDEGNRRRGPRFRHTATGSPRW